MAGEIPAQLGDLANLATLDLTHNRLTGEIPPELGRLPNLFWLLLTGNRLTGQIPPELGRNTRLDVLGLEGNQLTGQIPPGLGDLSKLSVLALNDNELTGTIPAELGRLSNLHSLFLGYNRLSGPIPPELGGLANVAAVDLRSNELSGEIPRTLGSLANLESLSLSDNRLIGEIPAELGTLTNLDLVHLSDNDLAGCIPEGLRSVENNDFGRLRLPFCDVLLSGLVVSPGSLNPPFGPYRTDYTAEVSAPIITILATGGHNATLRVLGQDDHELEDTEVALPGIQIGAGAAFTRITVKVVAADGEATHGYTIGIRRVLGAPSIAVVEVGGGYLAVSWAAPDGFAEARTASYDLRHIPTVADESVDANWTVVENVSTDSVDGNIQYTITGLSAGTQYEVQVRAVDLDGDPAAWSGSVTGTPTTPSVCVTGGAVTGAINPAIVSDCESLLAARDALAGSGRLNWSASTPIKDWDGITVGGTPPRVVGLSVNSRGLDGTIPAELGDLAGLRRLHLFQNRLTGPIPAGLGKLADLQSLDLSDNRLSGSIPSELGDLRNLVEVDLSGNDLRGCTPPAANADGGTSCFADEGMTLAADTRYLLRGDQLRITSVGDATNGVVTLVGTTITYRHDGSETNTDGFTYTISDGTESATASVTITVSPVNDPPVGVGDTLAVQEGGTVSVQAQRLLDNDSDAERDALSITAVGDADNGLVTLDGNTIVYRHDGSETTTGGFTYSITDGTDSATGLVTITVSPVNDPPVGVVDALAVQEGGSGSVQSQRLLVNDMDAERDALRITAVGDATNGLVTLDGNTIFYRHDGSETTAGSFTYTITDGTDSATALVTITVSPVDDPPVAVADVIAVQEGGTVSVQAHQLLNNDSDVEGDALRITAVGDAVNGLATLDGGTITYEHDGSETTTGGFTYTATDGTDTATALVNVTVSPVNDSPVGVDDTLAVQEGGSVSVASQQLLANDTDAEGDALRITDVGDAINGLVTLDGSTITYEHDGSETTAGSFTYAVSDRTDNTTVLVTITVSPVDDLPVLLLVSVALGAGLLALGILVGLVVGRKRKAS